MSYDSWLEKPYQDRAREDDAYVNWCEDNDLDPGDDHGDDFIQAMEDAREDALIEAADATRDDMEMDRWDW